jgi:hypothetical protein
MAPIKSQEKRKRRRKKKEKWGKKKKKKGKRRGKKRREGARERTYGAQHSFNLTARAGAHGLQVEGLPEVVDGAAARLGTSVDQHANVRVEDTAKGLEEPAMRVDLFLVLFLQAEEHLHGLLLGDELDDVVLDGHADLRRVLVDVGRDVLAVDLLLRNALLVHAHTGQQRPCPGVDLGTTVADDAHDDLLPGVLAPRLALGPLAHVLDVLEHTDHGAREQNLVLVVHGHHDEELGVPWLAEELLPEGEVVFVELGRVACRSRVAHVGELIALAVGQLVQQLRGDRAVQHQVSAVQEHLLHCLPPLNRLVVCLGLRVVMVGIACADVRVGVRQHWPAVVIVEGRRRLIVPLAGMRLVWLVVVGIVMRLGVDRVAPEVVNGLLVVSSAQIPAHLP